MFLIRYIMHLLLGFNIHHLEQRLKPMRNSVVAFLWKFAGSEREGSISFPLTRWSFLFYPELLVPILPFHSGQGAKNTKDCNKRMSSCKLVACPLFYKIASIILFLWIWLSWHHQGTNLHESRSASITQTPYPTTSVFFLDMIILIWDG